MIFFQNKNKFKISSFAAGRAGRMEVDQKLKINNKSQF